MNFFIYESKFKIFVLIFFFFGGGGENPNLKKIGGGGQSVGVGEG